MSDNHYIVYADVFFVINFIMDFFILWITGCVIRKKTGTLKMTFGAAAGAVYSLIVLKLPHNTHFLLLMNCLAAIVMLLISFEKIRLIKRKEIGRIFRECVIFFAVTFLIGGLMNMIYYSTMAGKTIMYIVNGETFTAIRTRTFLVSIFFTYLFLSITKEVFWDYKKQSRNMYKVELCCGKSTINGYGLYDTGNSAVEPLSGKIVHIADEKTMEKLIKGDEHIEHRFVVVPFNSVGKGDGILYGIRIDKMKVTGKNDKIVLNQPVIAGYKGRLTGAGNICIILNRDTFEIE